MWLALLLEPGRAIREQPRGVDLGRHVGELELDRVEVADPLPELVSLERIRTRSLVRRARDPDHLGRDADASAIERRYRHGEALALVVQKPIAADERAIDLQVGRGRRVEPELLLLTGHLDVLAVEDECRHTTRAGGRLVRACEEQERPCVAAI